MLPNPPATNITAKSTPETVGVSELLKAFLSGRSPRTSLTARGLQSATINRRLAAVRSLVKLAKTLGMVDWSLDIQNVKSEAYRDTKGPGKGGFRAMLQTLAARKTQKAVRDMAILRLLYDLALRTGEVVALNFVDVELGRGVIHVLGKGKTDKQQLSLPESTKTALTAWLEIRGNEPGALFQSLDRVTKGHRLTGIGIYKMVRALGETVGIKRHNRTACRCLPLGRHWMK